jgi:choline dehydrogenase-like flavoprotein
VFIDFNSAQSPQLIDCDLCIVGAGPSGIALAREFIGSRFQVYLIESGDFTAQPETQALYAGESVGRPHPPLSECQLRFFGGNSNDWRGHCAPLDASDFQARPWVPNSGWPFGREELDPYYRRAGILCQIGDWPFDDAYQTELGLHLPALDQARLRLCHWRNSPPTHFGSQYRQDLAGAANVHVLLNANTLRIDTDESGRQVVGIDIATLRKRMGRVRARHAVLAAGGIENPRLLLASNHQQPQGLGNGHDQVGRYFMEHPTSTAALAYSRPGDFLWSKSKTLHAVPLGVGFAGTIDQQRRDAALASMLAPAPASDPERRFALGGRPLPAMPEGYLRYVLRSQSEQSPDPISRVSLAEQKDRFGYPQAKLDWRLNELDKRTIKRQAMALGIEFARLRLGRIKLADWLLEDAAWEVQASDHHMGTTRLGDDPRTSVVDRHCQVHDIANLHIAGPSVFPTSGWVGPMLTGVAMTLRLADRLKQRLA